MKTIAVPAVIAKTQEELDSILSRIHGIADRIMLDIMDGEFVENESLNFDFTPDPGPEYEAHLMVADPRSWFPRLSRKVSRVIVHAETVDSIDATVDRARDWGYECYMAIKPETPAILLEPHLPNLDGILVMTVNPGRYGAPFLPDTLDKVKTIRSWSPDIPIEVDGGMNPETSKLAKAAGANIITSGSYIIKSGDVRLSMNKLVE